jgi:hypothetical protein
MKCNTAIKMNKYGNVDIRFNIPPGLTPIPRKAYGTMNIHSICRTLKIPCATALVGFDKSDGPNRPVLDGIVVLSDDYPKVMADIARRKEAEADKLERKRAKRLSIKARGGAL